MVENQDLVVLRTFGYRHEGEFAQSTLEAVGIRSALIVDDAGGAEMGLSFSNPARLLVRREDLPAALDALRECGLLT